MDMTATTYSYATVSQMSGETIKTVLEDVCDNLFNPDPYYQQGGDMVRVGGLRIQLQSAGAPWASASRDMRLNGKPIEASRQYKVAGWAPVAEEARNAGNKPVWELVEQWLKAKGGDRDAAQDQHAAAHRRLAQSRLRAASGMNARAPSAIPSLRSARCAALALRARGDGAAGHFPGALA